MRLITIIAALLISYVSFGQIKKKLPYEFDDSITINGQLFINDSIKISSNGFTFGQYVKVDTNASGALILVSDTVADATTTLPYDSITSAPFTKTGTGWRASDSANVFAIGGANDTSTASLYVKNGIARRIFELGDGETLLDGSRGDIFQVVNNSSPTAIGDFAGMEQGRIIMLLGRTSGAGANTTTITTNPRVVLTGASPITMDDLVVVTFITALDASGNQILLEISRNQ